MKNLLLSALIIGLISLFGQFKIVQWAWQFGMMEKVIGACTLFCILMFVGLVGTGYYQEAKK